jgi:deoxyribonuclease-4
MPLFGAHMSVAGGLHHALQDATAHGCDSVQIFSKNASRWQGKALTDAEAQLFREILQGSGLRQPMAHDSYLINLASPDPALSRKSVEALVDELCRAEALGLDYLIAHPGAHVGSGEEEGLARIAAALDEVHGRCPNFRVRILLETTAGQGTCLGHRFEHLARILGLVAEPNRLGVCFDTCHVFAAGYALAPVRKYRATMRAFDDTIGLSRLWAFHVNDSLRPFASRRDRHAHIGRGHLGLEPFRLLVNDPRFRDHSMILETPKSGGAEEDMDAVNLATLRGLVE